MPVTTAAQASGLKYFYWNLLYALPMSTQLDRQCCNWPGLLSLFGMDKSTWNIWGKNNPPTCPNSWLTCIQLAFTPFPPPPPFCPPNPVKLPPLLLLPPPPHLAGLPVILLLYWPIIITSAAAPRLTFDFAAHINDKNPIVLTLQRESQLLLCARKFINRSANCATTAILQWGSK